MGRCCQFERDVRTISDGDVPGLEGLERVINEVVPVRRRLAFGRQLRRIERAFAQRDERYSFCQHERNQKVIAPRQFTNHDQ